MGENLMVLYDNLSNFFYRKAYESFAKEKTIYDKYPELNIKTFSDLNGNKCKELFEKITGIKDDEILYMLRDKSFYEQIKNNFYKTVDTGLKKISDFDFTNITKNIRLRLNEKPGSSLTFDIVVNAIDKRYTTQGYKLLKEKLSATVERDLEENINALLSNINMTKTEKRGEISWKNENTKKMFELIEKEIGQDIFSKDEYFIVNQNMQDNIEEFKKSMITAIKSYKKFTEKNYENDSRKKSRTSSNIFLRNLKQGMYDNLIQKGFEKEHGKELIFGSKGGNFHKIKGDLTEFICGLILDNIDKKEKSFFAGSIQTSSGQAAIDIYSKQIGYQIKNFASLEGNPIIPLYQQRLKIQEIGNNTDGRTLTKEEKDQLYVDVNSYKYSEKSYKNDIFSILQGAFPNFIRYTQNWYNNDKDLLDKGFDKINNCFYILNFRIIPSSRIFYELYLQSLIQEKNEQLNNYFYINKDKKEDIEPSENLLNSINNFNPRSSFYLYFKGLQINQNGLRLNNSNTNLLSGSFKISSYRI